jgi:hypothetical protein
VITLNRCIVKQNKGPVRARPLIAVAPETRVRVPPALVEAAAPRLTIVGDGAASSTACCAPYPRSPMCPPHQSPHTPNLRLLLATSPWLPTPSRWRSSRTWATRRSSPSRPASYVFGFFTPPGFGVTFLARQASGTMATSRWRTPTEQRQQPGPR